MDTSTMTFGEILFHGRYHIIGAVLFVIFFGVFLQEAVRELLATRRSHAGAGDHAHGPVTRDLAVGATMADGGEPVDDAQDPPRGP